MESNIIEFVNSSKQLVVYKEKLNYKGFMIYTCKLVVNNQIMLLKNDTSIFKCINRVNKKRF